MKKEKNYARFLKLNIKQYCEIGELAILYGLIELLCKNPTNECVATTYYMAQTIGWSEIKIKRGLKKLRKLNLISVVSNKISTGKKGIITQRTISLTHLDGSPVTLREDKIYELSMGHQCTFEKNSTNEIEEIIEGSLVNKISTENNENSEINEIIDGSPVTPIIEDYSIYRKTFSKKKNDEVCFVNINTNLYSICEKEQEEKKEDDSFDDIAQSIYTTYIPNKENQNTKNFDMEKKIIDQSVIDEFNNKIGAEEDLMELYFLEKEYGQKNSSGEILLKVKGNEKKGNKVIEKEPTHQKETVVCSPSTSSWKDMQPKEKHQFLLKEFNNKFKAKILLEQKLNDAYNVWASNKIQYLVEMLEIGKKTKYTIDWLINDFNKFKTMYQPKLSLSKDKKLIYTSLEKTSSSFSKEKFDVWFEWLKNKNSPDSTIKSYLASFDKFNYNKDQKQYQPDPFKDQFKTLSTKDKEIYYFYLSNLLNKNKANLSAVDIYQAIEMFKNKHSLEMEELTINWKDEVLQIRDQNINSKLDLYNIFKKAILA